MQSLRKRNKNKNSTKRRNKYDLVIPRNLAYGRTATKIIMTSVNINSVITTGNYLFNSTDAFYNLFSQVSGSGDYAAMVSDWRMVKIRKLQLRISPAYRANNSSTIPYQPVMLSYQPTRVSVTAQSDVAINENAVVLNLNTLEDTLINLPVVSLTSPVTISGITYCLNPSTYTDTLNLGALPGCLVLNSNSTSNTADVPLFTMKCYFDMIFANPR